MKVGMKLGIGWCIHHKTVAQNAKGTPPPPASKRVKLQQPKVNVKNKKALYFGFYTSLSNSSYMAILPTGWLEMVNNNNKQVLGSQEPIIIVTK